MDKVDEAFLRSFREQGGSGRANGLDLSDEDLSINQRVAKFLMLLQQLDESAGGLGTLPPVEVSEIVSSALGVCGFVDPKETREVIATVLDVLKKPEPMAEVASVGSSRLARS
jgi:hypothetical protein